MNKEIDVIQMFSEDSSNAAIIIEDLYKLLKGNIWDKTISQMAKVIEYIANDKLTRSNIRQNINKLKLVEKINLLPKDEMDSDVRAAFSFIRKIRNSVEHLENNNFLSTYTQYDCGFHLNNLYTIVNWFINDKYKLESPVKPFISTDIYKSFYEHAGIERVVTKEVEVVREVEVVKEVSVVTEVEVIKEIHVVKCPTCSALNPTDEELCFECNSSLTVKQEATKNNECHMCTAPLNLVKSPLNCEYCGTAVN